MSSNDKNRMNFLAQPVYKYTPEETSVHKQLYKKKQITKKPWIFQAVHVVQWSWCLKRLKKEGGEKNNEKGNGENCK